jgi:hypothetical protein
MANYRDLYKAAIAKKAASKKKSVKKETPKVIPTKSKLE